jgi:hypothetical protein
MYLKRHLQFRTDWVVFIMYIVYYKFKYIVKTKRQIRLRRRAYVYGSIWIIPSVRHTVGWACCIVPSICHTIAAANKIWRTFVRLATASLGSHPKSKHRAKLLWWLVVEAIQNVPPLIADSSFIVLFSYLRPKRQTQF